MENINNKTSERWKLPVISTTEAFWVILPIDVRSSGLLFFSCAPYLTRIMSVYFRWETEPDYCSTIKKTPPYDKGTRLVDFIDMVILDFLMSRCTLRLRGQI